MRFSSFKALSCFLAASAFSFNSVSAIALPAAKIAKINAENFLSQHFHLKIDHSKARGYFIPGKKMKPKLIVLHETETHGRFPWDLEYSEHVSCHFVVDFQKIWQLLPLNVTSTCTYGIDDLSISIEMVASDVDDLALSRKGTMQAAAKLTYSLMREFAIPLSKVYSHEDVAQGKRVVPEYNESKEFFHTHWPFYENPNGYPGERTDPGEENMRVIKNCIQNLEKAELQKLAVEACPIGMFEHPIESSVLNP